MSAAISLGIEHIHRFASRSFAGELQENLLETTAARRLLAQVLNRSHRADFSLLDDCDPVAQSLRDLQCVRRHHDGVAAPHIFAKQILEDSRRLWIQSYHRFVDDNYLGPMNEGARYNQLLPHAVAVAFDELIGPLLQI